MVLGPGEHGFLADVLFVIEGTAVNGAYINDIKTNYIHPALEYFSQGNGDESNYVSENANSIYGIVVYQAADCLPHPSTDTFGPFASPGKLLSAIEKLELVGGKGESHANISEGLATALQCFEELEQKRENSANVQKHCILICNSPPYSMPVLESHVYSGKTSEQLAVILQENNINLSVISPRKIPSLYKLFEKAGGDLPASQSKNYAKDPRHLVLLKGFSLKERPISPPPSSNVTSSSQSQVSNPTIPITSLPSPGSDRQNLGGGDQNSSNIMGGNAPAPGAGQSPVYRPPNPQGVCQLPNPNQGMLGPAQKGVPVMGGRMIGSQPMPNQINAPPQYQTHVNRSSPHWQMPPPVQQQRPYLPNQPGNPAQGGSALIAQLTQPPSSMPGNNVGQFGQMNANSPGGKMNLPINPQQNVQGPMSQNPPGISQLPMSGIQTSQPNQMVTSQAQSPLNPNNPNNQQSGPARERYTIWQGLLEWIEKPKNATDQQKVTKHVPCQVSANTKEGEPELKADGWPQKLIMQLMPKQLIGNIGGAYLKNSKSVLFHPTNCEALESLTRVMSSGFAGCVHFTSVQNSPCDIKVLILLYTTDKRAYLGFIPNDQAAFVDRLRKVIQQQKSTQQMRQGQIGGPINSPISMGGTPPQMGPGGNNPVTSQQTSQGLIMSQTNTLSMAGGQITQNVPTSSGQPGNPGMGGIMGQQNVPGQGMRPNIRMQGIQQPNSQPLQPGIMGVPPQRAPIENQIQVERQQNLDKINQLRQTLEVAQQQEQQYKTQLERISHMKTSQLQEALHVAQQQEMQYKMMEQQRQGMPTGAAPPNPGQQQQQQRMMRPMSNNPGLRHLLQQQPQYRPQMMGMPTMGGNGGQRPPMGQQMSNPGGAPQTNFDDVPNFDLFNA